MKSFKNLLILSLATTAIALSAPAAYAKKTKVAVEFKEWNITLSEEFVPAGEIEFSVKNKGKEEHEMVILKLNTDVATGRLPVNKDGSIDEDNMTFGVMIGEVEGLASGKKAKESFNLKPGRYAVICNILEEEPSGEMEAHYSMGMHAVLNVE